MNPFPTTAVLALTKSEFLPRSPKPQHKDTEPLLRSRTSQSGDWFSQAGNRLLGLTVATSPFNSKSPARAGNSRSVTAFHENANDAPPGKRPEHPQDAGKGDCSGCDCGFLLKTAAEISVTTRPIGKGSMNVIAAFSSGFLYSSLYFFTC
jgi:hypothetical protein